jgi:hypothetical protein
MNISLTDILITIFLLLIYKLLQKRCIKVDNFTEDIINNKIVDKPKIDISKLSIIENNIKMNLTKNNNSFDLNGNLTYKIVRPIKNWIKMNDKKFNLKKITISKSNNNSKNIQLEIQLHFTDLLKIIIPVVESKKDNHNLQLFRIDHFDTYQSGKYLIKNLPRKVQGVNNKSIVFNIWFYPLVKFINSNKKLYLEKSNNTIYTTNYYLNSSDINNINECL